MAKIKFCGLSQVQDIEYANKCLPDYIGFVFAKSKRNVTPQDAITLRKRLSPSIQAVGVFVNDDINKITTIADSNTIDLIQLHGNEDLEYIQSLKSKTKLPIIKAIQVQTTADILTASVLPVDYILLDTYSKGQYGGIGKQFDWSLIPKLSIPFFLAGGINCNNISQALKTHAFCLDCSSSLEANGHKDYKRMLEIKHKIDEYNI